MLNWWPLDGNEIKVVKLCKMQAKSFDMFGESKFLGITWEFNAVTAQFPGEQVDLRNSERTTSLPVTPKDAGTLPSLSLLHMFMQYREQPLTFSK